MKSYEIEYRGQIESQKSCTGLADEMNILRNSTCNGSKKAKVTRVNQIVETYPVLVSSNTHN